MYAASSRSSKPTTAWSRGTSYPASVSVRSSPIALKSLPVSTAVDGMPAAIMVRAACSPPLSWLLPVLKNSSGSGSIPYSRRVSL